MSPHRPIPPGPVVDALRATGLPRCALARWLGVSPRALAYWRTGEHPTPGPVRRACQVLAEVPPAAWPDGWAAEVAAMADAYRAQKRGPRPKGATIGQGGP